jgi:hypothetical protein
MGGDFCVRIFAECRKNQQFLHIGRHFFDDIEDLRQQRLQLRIALG